jgi:hypothetical protein
MAKLVRLPISLGDDDRARANAERTRRLFEWAAMVLQHLGLVGAVTEATTIEELRNITVDIEDAEVSLAIDYGPSSICTTKLKTGGCGIRL